MIYDIIKELASNNSRLFKEGVLIREKDNELLKRVLFLALDPLTQFYIRKIPEYVTEYVTFYLDFGLDRLDDLSHRLYTGHGGIEHLRYILAGSNPLDAEVIKLIIGKDLKCGVSSSTANKIWPSLISDIPYMRCSSLTELKPNTDVTGWISQVKLDGMFCNINHNSNGSVSLYSRGGNHFPLEQFTDLVKDIQKNIPVGYQLHGELLVLDKNTNKIQPREIGNGILNSVLKGGEFELNQTPIIEVWDMIPIISAVSKGFYNSKYIERFKVLSSVILHSDFIRLVETKFINTLKEAYEHYFECLVVGLEGTVLKNPNMIWEDKTSKGQFKVKIIFDLDLVITGFTEGSGKNAKTFGSITCESSDGLLSVNVSGITDKQRTEIYENKESYIGKIITVMANNIMYASSASKKHSLFLPRFVEVRLDKTEADSMERIKSQLQSAMNIASLIKE